MYSKNNFHIKRLEFLSFAIGSLVTIYGIIVIIAWRNDLSFLKTLGLGEIPIKANAGACFLFSGLSLILLQFTHTLTRIMSRLFSFCTIVIGLLSIAEIAFSVNLGIDEVLFRRLYLAGSVTGPTRMAFNAAICQILIATALFHLSLKNIRFTYLVEFCLVFASSISFLGLLGFFNGLVQLSEATGYLNMASIAAIVFILMSFGILLTFYSKIPLIIEINRRIFAGTIFTATIIVFISIISINGYKSIRQTNEISDRSQRIKNHLNLLFSDILDVETGVRGYLVSSDEEYIQSIAKTKEDFIVSIYELSELLKDNKVQLLRLDTLNQLIRDRVEQAELLEAVIRPEGKNPGIDFFGTKKGKILTDRIRILILNMKDEENQLLKFRNDNEALKSLNAQTIIYLNLALELILIALIFIVIRRNISQRNKAITEFQKLNEDLEVKVTERTAFLAESEEKYRYLFANNPQPMWIYDLETLSFLEVNHVAISHYGYSREEFLSMTLKDIRPAEDVDALLNAVNQLQKTYNPAAEWRHVMKSGEIINVEIVSHTITFNNRKARHVMVTDITERHKTREAMLKAKANLDAALASMTDAVFISNVAGEFTEFNEAFATFHKFRNKNECAKTLAEYPLFVEVYSENGQLAEMEQWAVPRALRGETSQNEVYLMRRKDTGETWVGSYNFAPMRDNHGNIVGSVVTAHDITSRKQAEEEIQRLNARITAATNAAQVGIWDWDIINNTLVWDDQMFKLYGLERDSFSGAYEAWISGLHPDDREFSDKESKAAIHGEKQYDTEFRIVWPDGSIHFLKAKGNVIVNKEGKPARMIGVNYDISRLKWAESEIKKLNEELEIKVLERTAQLESVNTDLESFSYSVSHDLRAPLRHISGFVDILSREYNDQLPENAKHYLQTIAGSAQKMKTLIEDLLSLSRTGRAEMRKAPVSMIQIVEDVLTQFRPAVADRIIEWEIDSLPEVNGDYHLLHLVWVNLIDNAIKYTSTREEAVIQIGYKETRKEFIFSILDNGVGFDMKYAKKLFGVFQRLHSSAQFEGTGIGLANVQRIISRHGGRVWAEAEPEKGASFYFSIPNNNRKNNEIKNHIAG